ncbi:exodeoxyribonuclease VII large subunit [Methyloradius palustris]|uniref:Exodeoxyribonuclease 7 large subunit n=1 Tax=Methyloradius palustris TaxID=2778876 RepID=A0A8D5JYD1_9PROT|nr:exodeoxyribonuclease VII large subunit [Methyloradius palustris]BCM24597.1 exodeoxyribonuclease 7 large subunit [Methyloradius palustris]
MAENQAIGSPTKVLTVSELNRLARDVLERSFPLFWVSGEISNLTRAASGHWYFSLKDSGAQVRCVMFKNRNSYLGWIPKEGDKVEARAVVSFYEARGEFQLAIEFLQQAGLGALFEAYERLRLKLESEGLFDAAFKKPLHQYPRQIGIITSADAAALRDVLSTLKRRMPSIPVILYPTPVQGKGVANLIATAIDKASKRAECDVLILCRGGGSIEDLWQFNEEIVARAIHACQIPIISGVGHETDFTIADFVADYRAPTPTAAAELATPDRNNLLAGIMQIEQRISRQIRYLLENRSQQLDYLSRRLLSPLQQIKHKRDTLTQLQSRLKTASTTQLQQQQQRLIQLGQNLQHLNPQAVLERGYAYVENANGELVSSSKGLKTGQRVALNFKDGKTDAEILPASLFRS